ncbi:glycoside hydrolase family 16 protein [Flagelloscypha sp. PMI_526]|nr:glycoside hydrolase family 16 protein [Flagelloscypha sp. PMI_526]
MRVASLLLSVPLAIAATTETQTKSALQITSTSGSGSFVSKVEDITHSIAHDLRVAFAGLLVRQASHRKRAKLTRRGQGVLSSEYCTIAAKNVNNTASNEGSNTHSPGGNSDTSDQGPPPSYNPSATATTFSDAPPPSATATSKASNWKLAESHQGTSFFDGWDFYTDSDPTHGRVTFVPANAAFDSGLASVSNSSIFMRVDTEQTVSDTRQSVRITTRSQWSNGGLFMTDIQHMPTGCAVWPAWWSNGPSWPDNGEIDILEGIHDATHNQMTLHTTVGCTLPSTDPGTLGMTGTLVGTTDCAVANTANAGCGVRAPESNSYGKGFNNAGGGVYAMLWTSDGIEVHFFSRGSIPSDIKNGSPTPESWPTPQARFPATQCDPFKIFKQQSFIFDTTLCGDWAGSAWNSAGSPGQEESCASRTGFSSCEEYVRQRGDAFTEAFWEVNWVRIYKQKS